ncbi:MAG TPA: NlpC/P60 family protein [Candidatus Paceibacterota bacterium]|nr:NlpC/P60 family protein [Candidatus Paceibacterota bacterium]
MHPFAHELTSRERAVIESGTTYRVATASAVLYHEPTDDSQPITTVLHGEHFYVQSENEDGWAYGYASASGWMGHLRISELHRCERIPTHRICQLFTLVYAQPTHRSRVLMQLGMNARVHVTDATRKFYQVATGGWIPKTHLEIINRVSPDFVAEAEKLVGIPYRPGGRDPLLGLNCSGLVHHALLTRNIILSHGVRHMERELEKVAIDVYPHGPFKRGDLVFWDRHVGIMVDDARLVHATNIAMRTLIQPLDEVNPRQGPGGITSVWRLAA